jgi:hypothetical protein
MSDGTVYVNPFLAGDNDVIIPAGTPYIQNYDDRDTHVTKRTTTIVVDDVEPGQIRYVDRFRTVSEEQDKVDNPFGHTIVTTTVRSRSTIVHEPLIGKAYASRTDYRQYVITADLLEANGLPLQFTEPVDVRR